MKPLSNIGYCRVLVLAVLTIISCTKQDLTSTRNNDAIPSRSAASKPFKISANGYFRMAPSSAPSTYVQDGITYTTGNFTPAQLNANASGFGDATLYLNHQLYFGEGGSSESPAGVLPASVSLIQNYPLQPQDPSGTSEIGSSDFAGLGGMQSQIDPPATVKGFKVNAVLYGGSKDAVYLALEPPAQCAPSSHQLMVHGNALIVGGSGKYTKAYGRLSVACAMAMASRQVSFSVDGWISF